MGRNLKTAMKVNQRRQNFKRSLLKSIKSMKENFERSETILKNARWNLPPTPSPTPTSTCPDKFNFSCQTSRPQSYSKITEIFDFSCDTSDSENLDETKAPDNLVQSKTGHYYDIKTAMKVTGRKQPCKRNLLKSLELITEENVTCPIQKRHILKSILLPSQQPFCKLMSKYNLPLFL